MGLHGQDSPSHSSETLQMREYIDDSAPWQSQDPRARRGDPRLRPDAGLLYGKAATQYGQSAVTARPADSAVTQPVASEMPVPGSNAASQSAVTPGLFTVIIIYSH